MLACSISIDILNIDSPDIENTYTYTKISNKVERIDNFRALARKLSFLSTELDIFDIRRHYVRILFIFQRLIC